jgi:hypothetical protein
MSCPLLNHPAFLQGYRRAIDLALPSERIAIEANGPHHFCCNSVHGQHWPLGRNTARDRLLQGHGWRVLAVDQRQWEALAASKRERWLAMQLAKVRQFPAPEPADFSGDCY